MAKAVDWLGIEMEFRAGRLSLREIADKYSVNGVSITMQAIEQRGKRHGWTRDLAGRIHVEAESKLARKTKPGLDKATEREVVEANAEQVAKVRGEHRADIGRARKLCLKLLHELEAETNATELLTRLPEILEEIGEGQGSVLNEVFRKVVSLPGRVDAVKKMAEAMKTVVTLEREAYGIDKIVEAIQQPEVKLDLGEVARRMAFVMTSASQPAQQVIEVSH